MLIWDAAEAKDPSYSVWKIHNVYSDSPPFIFSVKPATCIPSESELCRPKWRNWLALSWQEYFRFPSLCAKELQLFIWSTWLQLISRERDIMFIGFILMGTVTETARLTSLFENREVINLVCEDILFHMCCSHYHLIHRVLLACNIFIKCLWQSCNPHVNNSLI